MTIQEKAYEAADEAVIGHCNLSDVPQEIRRDVADAVAVAVLREARAHTNPRTGQVSGFWIDHALAQFSGDQPRPETETLPKCPQDVKYLDTWTLIYFGSHLVDCAAGPNASKRHYLCDCGLSAAINEMEARTWGPRLNPDHKYVAPPAQAPETLLLNEYLRQLGALRDMLNAPQSIGLWKVTVFTNPERLAALDAAIDALRTKFQATETQPLATSPSADPSAVAPLSSEPVAVKHVPDPFEGYWEYHVLDGSGEALALCGSVAVADVIASLLNHPDIERLKAEALSRAYREAVK